MNILIEKEKKERMDPLLKKKGLTFSSWVRVEMDKFLDEHQSNDFSGAFSSSGHPGGDAA